MNTIRAIGILIAVGALVGAVPSLSPAFDLNQCAVPCKERHKACYEPVKDSPNDIDRELCDNERKECFAACDAAFIAFQKEEADRQRLEHEEKARLGIKEKRLSNEEEAEVDAQRERDEQEQKAREEQERQEKASQEKREGETVNGIPIYQFK